MRQLLCVSGILFGIPLASCDGLQESRTLGEVNTGFNYIPVDPLPVTVFADGLVNGQFPAGTTAKGMREKRYLRCVARGGMDKAEKPAAAGAAGPARSDDDPADVMDALPDQTIRMAVRNLSGKGSGGFGPVGLSGSGGSYQVVMDSIIADTTNVRVGIQIESDGKLQSVFSLPEKIPAGTKIIVVRLSDIPPAPPLRPDLPDKFEEIYIPVYVGVGLRLTANVFTSKSGINLANLPAIAVSVDSEQSGGSIAMQTLGVYNQQVASTFAIPSELSTASVQNALVGMGAVKAIVYDRDTGTRPRLTGIYNPLPTSDPRLINKIYTALASRPIPWAPCASS